MDNIKLQCFIRIRRIKLFVSVKMISIILLFFLISLGETSSNIRICCPTTFKYDSTIEQCVKSSPSKVLQLVDSKVEKCHQTGVLIKQSGDKKFYYGQKLLVNFSNHNERISFDNYCINSYDEVMICEKIAFLKLCCAENEFYDIGKSRCMPKFEETAVRFIDSNRKTVEGNISVHKIKNSFEENKNYGLVNAFEVKVFQNGSILFDGEFVSDDYCYTNGETFLVEGDARSIKDPTHQHPLSFYYHIILKCISLTIVVLVEYFYWSKKLSRELSDHLFLIHVGFMGFFFLASILDELVAEWTPQNDNTFQKLPLLFLNISTFSWLTMTWIGKLLHKRDRNAPRHFMFFTAAVTIPLVLMVVIDDDDFSWQLFYAVYLTSLFAVNIICFICLASCIGKFSKDS